MLDSSKLDFSKPQADLALERNEPQCDKAPDDPSASLRALATRLSVSKGSVAEVQVVSGSKPRVLIAEDNAINQKVASHLLQRLGYLTEVAGNGEEALAALSRSAFDLVLMDIQMPVMDGYEACKAIRASGEEWSDIPIVALTANALPEVKEKCLTLGMNDFLTKPVTKDKLALTLSRNFHSSGSKTQNLVLAASSGESAWATGAASDSGTCVLVEN